jgi:hypothetical protein
VSQMLIPPHTGESSGFYDDDENHDRLAARLIGEALGNTIASDAIAYLDPTPLTETGRLPSRSLVRSEVWLTGELFLPEDPSFN